MVITPIRTVLKNARGGTAIEYGLIAALIVIAMLASFVGVANTTTGMWSNVNTKMDRSSNGR